MNKIINILKKQKSIPLDRFIDIALYDKKLTTFLRYGLFYFLERMSELLLDLSRLWVLFTRAVSCRPGHAPGNRTPHYYSWITLCFLSFFRNKINQSHYSRSDGQKVRKKWQLLRKEKVENGPLRFALIRNIFPKLSLKTQPIAGICVFIPKSFKIFSTDISSL